MSLDVYLEEMQPTEVFWQNITHNLGQMAREAGLYEALWRPEELKIKRAGELLPTLRAGFEKLLADRERLQQFNPENGWGHYDNLVEFTRRYIAACEEHPSAEIRVSR